jgi:hypothetical protein
MLGDNNPMDIGYVVSRKRDGKAFKGPRKFLWLVSTLSIDPQPIFNSDRGTVIVAR